MAKQKQNKTLSPAHDKFCQHYAEYSNGAMAYLFAFPNVTYGSARTLGSELLTKVDIKARIEQLIEEFNVQYKQDKRRTIRDLIVAAEEAKAMAQFPAYAKLREMIIKMEGFYEPDKIELSGTINFELKVPGVEPDKDEDESEDND
jgi:phage terminase small subunit